MRLGLPGRTAVALAALARRLNTGPTHMERIARLHIERLPEGVYLATSDDIPGLVAQGRTVTETIEIARDVARKLIDAQVERVGSVQLAELEDVFDYPLVLG